MREILFRFWNGKEMLDWSWAQEYQVEHVFRPDVEVWKVMQSTGLKDKNGVLIYEGDIVYKERGGKDHDWKKDGWQTTIIWNNDHACFEEKETGNDIDREYMQKVKIIGNVWENSELLSN